MTKTIRIHLQQGAQTLADVTLSTSLDQGKLPQLLQYIHDLTQDTIPAAPGTIRAQDAAALKTIGKKYLALAEYLARIQDDTTTLTFNEIEQLLGAPLPATARGQHARAWWANTDTHSQGKAWLAVGWKTITINPEQETVEFRRK
ncbi:hypothetical protein GO986_12625 [Deinococcus sp. HMF7620]|uniref:DUF7662 domain-containing protein n=1 Tax=Deinococcus arboris TaxID=2682977 RepID=A0A7C9I3L8_9DEIO|nr:hypothetical protein [Deinococcus arboris]MVN87611.1 hypothetical protein [Deinococcus arboris]